VTAQLVELEYELEAVSRARGLVTTACAHLPGDVTDVVRVVVSELVANAVLHGLPEIVLLYEIGPDLVRVEVTDGHPQPPRQLRASLSALDGRGLLIVNALSRRWGVVLLDDGKTVWCDIPVRETAGAIS
jgi:anti-sigma regulatory factor (Ser/Thr protein kinase)